MSFNLPNNHCEVDIVMITIFVFKEGNILGGGVTCP